MAKYSYQSYIDSARQQKRGSKEPYARKVGYFKLINDGDKAVVRFDYSNADEFDIYDVHTFKNKEGHYRNVLCLKKNFRDPDADCPFCKAGYDAYPLRTKFYVKLIQYVPQEDGSIKVEPKVWERPANFAKTIDSFINDYGDLHDVVFIVTRNGERGSRDTTYSINLALPSKYNEANGYAKDFSGFDGFNLVGHSFMSRDYEEMEAFVATGDFPLRKRNDASEIAKPSIDEIPYVAHPSNPIPSISKPSVSASESNSTADADSKTDKQAQFQGNASAIQNADPTVSRPRRIYNF